MIFKTYLNFKVKTIFILLFILLIFFNLFWCAFICLLIFILLLFLFKKRSVELNLLQGDVIFTPCFGKVVGINTHMEEEIKEEKNINNFFSIDILLLPFEDIGLYFPTKCEFSLYRKNKGSKILFPASRYVANDSKYQEIVFIKQGKDFFMLRLYSSIFTRKAYVYPLPGDYGHTGANFGIFPFGGIIRFYLPKTYELTAEIGKKVIPSQSILAKKKN